MTRRLRALLIATDYPPMGGGIARLLGDLVYTTADAVEWRVLTLGRGADDPGVTRVPGLNSLPGAVARHSLWLRSSPDAIVVCGHVYVIAFALMAGRLARAPVGTLIYGKELVPQRNHHRVALAGLRLSDRVVAISHHSAAIARRLGVSPCRVRVCNPAPRPPWTAPSTMRTRRLGEGLRLVAVSRLDEGYKNLELLLRAASVLAPSGVIAGLTIVGDGPRRPALLEKARQLTTGQLVQLPGALDDGSMASVLRDSHLGMFPSRDSIAEGGFEGFGLVVHELASAGLPVLASRAGGAIDAVDPGWSLLLDPDDLRAWTQAIERLYGDEAGRLRMAASALEWSRCLDRSASTHRFIEALAG